MLSTSDVLCNFPGMLQDFPGSLRLGMGTGEKGAWRYWGGDGEEKKKSRVSIHHSLGCLGQEVIAIKIQAGCVG